MSSMEYERTNEANGAYRTKSVCKNPYNTRYLLVL